MHDHRCPSARVLLVIYLRTEDRPVPGSGPNMPSGHRLHLASLTVPVVLTYLPWGHLVQLCIDVPPVMARYRPCTHTNAPQAPLHGGIGDGRLAAYPLAEVADVDTVVAGVAPGPRGADGHVAPRTVVPRLTPRQPDVAPVPAPTSRHATY